MIARSKIKTLIEEQIQDMNSAKLQLSMWITWKKKIGQPLWMGHDSGTANTWLSLTDKFTAKIFAKVVRKNRHRYLLDVDVDYPETLHDKHNELPFLLARMARTSVGT